MLAHRTTLLLLALITHLPLARSEEPKLVSPSKERVVAALRQTAEALRSRSIEPAEQASFHELLAAADALAKDESVPLVERERWRGMARVRLGEGADLLRRQLARSAKQQPPAGVKPPHAPVLAQQGFGVGPVVAGATTASPDVEGAQELIDLITGVVRPESWEARGGQGVIRYWSLGGALIIRNTADVQEQVGGAVGLLRP